MQIRPLQRSDTTLSDDAELANITYNDKYVVVYDFSNVGKSTVTMFMLQADVNQMTMLRLRNARLCSMT
jgi:hypothetical protein